MLDIRRSAVETVEKALRPLVAGVQRRCGSAPGLWTDPYVLGFFFFMIAHHAKRATRGRITGEELGQAFKDSFSALSNSDGAALTTLANGLLVAQDREFMRGSDDAAVISYYELQALKNEADHPLVIAAARLALAPSDRGSVLAMMVDASLMREVQTRLRKH